MLTPMIKRTLNKAATPLRYESSVRFVFLMADSAFRLHTVMSGKGGASSISRTRVIVGYAK